VAEAGIYEIGRQCDQYLDVLFRFNRNQRAIRQGLTATGAATASILGVAGVVAMPIAITAVAFGLAASLYDAGVNSVLFTIEPSALRNVVLKGRQAYINRLDLSKVNSRPRLLIAMQGYLTQCSPATIEANVNNAASGAESVVNVRRGESADGAILGAPAVTLIERATPPATPTQIATAVVTHTVQPPPPPPVEARPRNAKPEEKNVTLEQLKNAQRALGVDDDGNFGPIDDSVTRMAIREFQRGLIRRNIWDAKEETGMLTGNTYDILAFIGPMSRTPFFTPFERSYLGNRTGAMSARYATPDDSRLQSVLARYGVPEAQWDLTKPGEMLKLLRPRFNTLRTEKGVGAPVGVEPAKSRPDVLDNALVLKMQ
jgi:hypothetical protein